MLLLSVHLKRVTKYTSVHRYRCKDRHGVDCFYGTTAVVANIEALEEKEA